MDPVLRKRVTRVGSGAWSIYLPKKWIDTWEPAQQEGREVDLRAIGPGILITPAIARSHYQAVVPVQPQAIQTWLLSGYLRGYHDVVLRPAEGSFDHDCIAEARDFLRHLDERLEAQCSPAEIGFRLRADLPAAVSSGEDLLQMMAAKVDEVLALAGDALAHHPHDPDRVLHSLRLLRDTHEEDVARLYHQATRLVATLEIPMPSVSAYQLLGLAAADLHRIGEQAIRIAATLLSDYGLRLDDLDYPRSHLMERMRLPPPPAGLIQGLYRNAASGIEPTRQLLQRLVDHVRAADIAALGEVASEAEKLTQQVRTRLFQAAGEYWGQGDVGEAAEALGATKHTTSIVVTLDHIRAIAVTAATLLAADVQEDA